MFAYCGNNPVVNKDSTGMLFERNAGGGYIGEGSGGAGGSNSAITSSDVLWPTGWGLAERAAISGIAAAGVVLFTHTMRDLFYEQISIRQFNRQRQEQVAKADALLKSVVTRQSKVRYWSATINRAYVDIGRPLTFGQAVHEVAAGRNVFAVTRWEAKAVARSAGGRVGFNNGELPNDVNKKGTIGYYDHFHTYNRNGGHVFYLFG